VKDFISQLMQFNPDNRLTAKEALEHEWIMTRAANVITDDKVTAEAFENLSKFRVSSTVCESVV
jgi:serine/threonine protein kinase